MKLLIPLCISSIILIYLVTRSTNKCKVENKSDIQLNNEDDKQKEGFGILYGKQLDTVDDKGALYTSKFLANSGSNFYFI
jgi:hypothetical protein